MTHGKLTVAEAAGRLGVCERTIRRYLAAGVIAGTRVGPKLIRIDAAELDRLTSTPYSVA
jgi:excisionase family DNA binding protein